MMRTRKTVGARGFSLLELLVAMSVMALSLTLLYQVDAGVLRGVADYQMQQRATLLAQSVLDSRDAVPVQGWREQGQSAGLEWSVDSELLARPAGLSEQAPLLHAVHLEVRWPGRQGPQSLVVETVLPQALPAPGGSAR